jgi:HPt (histidine-containing phosphotransfer) domain-containing protein
MTDAARKADRLVSTLAGDEDMLDLVEIFVSELPGRVGAIHQALAHQDFETLQRLAHQLKGAAGGYGFPAITDAAKELELSTNINADIERLDEQFRELADLCTRARATAS